MAQHEPNPTVGRARPKHLPVPPLQQSLDSYLSSLSPLLTEEEHRVAVELAAAFATTDGPACQAELERFAAQENAAGRSWLSEAWLSGYFANRAPLTLSSNVGFRVRQSGGSSGIDRAADVIHRVASVHLSYLRGEMVDAISPRGNALDMRQWQVLEGGLRHPHPVEDFFRDGRPGAPNREVGVLWRGRMIMTPISDSAGRALSRASLVATLKQLETLPISEDESFTHLSYLGGDKASAHLGALLQDPVNLATYERLTDAVFLVNLIEESASDERHQERMTFEPGQAWVYKPFTYQISLVDDFLGVHVEHSIVDGATLTSMIEMVQQIPADDHRADKTPGQLEQLVWVMSPGLPADIARDMEIHRARAETYRVRILTCPAVIPLDGFTVSHDAIQQFSLLHAQLSAYGKVRSTYEAVDMREFQAGRTECLRPITNEAVALVRALIDGEAAPQQLDAALAAHKSSIIACKTGQGFSRHLLGLSLMADRLGVDPPLFRDGSFRAMTTDFLSTTSVGSDAQIMRFSFAPTSAGGIGVNYTVLGDTYEFCLTHDSEQSRHIDRFMDGIEAGISALSDLVAEAQQR